MPRVVHFEIHADDPERAISFYQSVFGWQFQKWEGPLEYWMIITGPGINEGTPGILTTRPSMSTPTRSSPTASKRTSDRSSPQDAHTRRCLAGLRQGYRRKHLWSPPGGRVRRLISRNRLLSDCRQYQKAPCYNRRHPFSPEVNAR